MLGSQLPMGMILSARDLGNALSVMLQGLGN